jgi:stage III sporulation protein SpoIIIAA
MPPSVRAHWEATEEYRSRVVRYLGDKSGPVPLTTIGQNVPRQGAAELLKMAQLLMYDARFRVEGLDGNKTVRLAKPVALRQTQSDALPDMTLSNATNDAAAECASRSPQLISTTAVLDVVLAEDPAFALPDASPNDTNVVALAFDGSSERLRLLEVATAGGSYTFDCEGLGAGALLGRLAPLLGCGTLVLTHDLHAAADALQAGGGVAALGFARVLDMQLAAEHAAGCAPHADVGAMLRALGVAADSEGTGAAALQLAWPALRERLGPDLAPIECASLVRAARAMPGGRGRAVAFDRADGFRIASAELLAAVRPADALAPSPLSAQVDARAILGLIPVDLRRKLLPPGEERDLFDSLLGLLDQAASVLARKGEEEEDAENHDEEEAPAIPIETVSDIVIDVGRAPHCWAGGARHFLSDEPERLGTTDDVEFVRGQVGGFGSDNRAGIDGQLHRVSALLNRDGRTAGLTMRLGRAVRGNADMIADILLGTGKSVLLLGEPGAGKTTIVREAARLLAEHSNVLVVDTSNEIAGDGMVPHECIGLARRMMVASLDAQAAVMVECVQNHTPHVMVIDEIGRPREVNAARTCKQRGVRLIASAHGDLRKLVR